jgi:3-oxoacyl-[acyl-carrier-protein] synthase-1
MTLLKKSFTFTDLPMQSTVFLYCAAKGDIRGLEETVINGSTNYPVSPLLDLQAHQCCDTLGIHPARIMVVSNACASGAVGLHIAAEMLREGIFTHAIVAGFDCISRFTITGFNSLNALSGTGARPFDAQRNGLILGEGAGVAVLSYRETHAGDCSIVGAGSSNDANHRTGPSRTGDGLHAAARAALTDAGLRPGDIGGVKCHGTATPYNDAMEAKALSLVFGNSIPPCVSLKGAIGHLSGAGSLIEILISAKCLKRRTLPQTAGYETHGVDEPVPVTSKATPITQSRLLCLAAGFGGLNAAVVIEEHS